MSNSPKRQGRKEVVKKWETDKAGEKKNKSAERNKNKKWVSGAQLRWEEDGPEGVEKKKWGESGKERGATGTIRETQWDMVLENRKGKKVVERIKRANIDGWNANE